MEVKKVKNYQPCQKNPTKTKFALANGYFIMKSSMLSLILLDITICDPLGVRKSQKLPILLKNNPQMQHI